MDVNRDGLLREAINVCLAVPGAFSVRELFEMEWPEYEKMIEILREREVEQNARG